jgi:hypothetical protein
MLTLVFSVHFVQLTLELKPNLKLPIVLSCDGVNDRAYSANKPFLSVMNQEHITYNPEDQMNTLTQL